MRWCGPERNRVPSWSTRSPPQPQSCLSRATWKRGWSICGRRKTKRLRNNATILAPSPRPCKRSLCLRPLQPTPTARAIRVRACATSPKPWTYLLYPRQSRPRLQAPAPADRAVVAFAACCAFRPSTVSSCCPALCARSRIHSFWRQLLSAGTARNKMSVCGGDATDFCGVDGAERNVLVIPFFYFFSILLISLLLCPVLRRLVDLGPPCDRWQRGGRRVPAACRPIRQRAPAAAGWRRLGRHGHGRDRVFGRRTAQWRGSCGTATTLSDSAPAADALHGRELARQRVRHNTTPVAALRLGLRQLLAQRGPVRRDPRVDAFTRACRCEAHPRQ